MQGTFETFAAMADKHFGGSLTGKLLVSGGMGGMGGAQPLAATLNGAVFLGIDVDEARIRRRIDTGYCDRLAHTLDEALALCEEARLTGNALSVGLVGNCAERRMKCARRVADERHSTAAPPSRQLAQPPPPSVCLPGPRPQTTDVRLNPRRGPTAPSES